MTVSSPVVVIRFCRRQYSQRCLAVRGSGNFTRLAVKCRRKVDITGKGIREDLSDIKAVSIVRIKRSVDAVGIMGGSLSLVQRNETVPDVGSPIDARIQIDLCHRVHGVLQRAI